MLRFKQFILEKEEYQGLHTSPGPDSGSPLHDLTNTYPDDIYGPHGARYYGHFGNEHPIDRETISIIRQYRNRPDAKVSIFRAVPKIKTKDERIAELEKHQKHILKTGKIPKGVTGFNDSSDYYTQTQKELDKLNSSPEEPHNKLQINPTDWVTINRNYTKDHGESHLNGNYRILRKVVPAKHLFTNGDSIHEFGYHPH